MARIPSNQKKDLNNVIPVERLASAELGCCRDMDNSMARASDSQNLHDSFGEPEVDRPIGKEYQAELPTCEGEYNYSNYADGEHRLLVGLEVPLTRITSVNHEGHLIAPEKNNESWDETEKASFILGLYIFERKLNEVQKFVETKGMGTILSYYHSKFYGSSEHQRWTQCRKTKSKRSACGVKLFSGTRRQELLSRLLPRVPDERRNALLEVSKSFDVKGKSFDGKEESIDDKETSLAVHVSSLKAIVGINNLVEAVGIGTMHDLTRMQVQPWQVRRRMPVGKEWSFLTTSELVKFLTGSYRMSKARLEDMFWEAVWPRLLDRGWHSEASPNRGHEVKSSDDLIYFIPGVQQLSRRELVKGQQFFDSIADVLSKVAIEPGLIKLDNEEANGDKSEEDENDAHTRKRHLYLRPRTSNRGSDSVSFTVVDTSLPDDKVRELRTLSAQILSTPMSLSPIDNIDEEILTENAGGSNTSRAINICSFPTDNMRTARSIDERPHESNKHSSAHDNFPSTSRRGSPRESLEHITSGKIDATEQLEENRQVRPLFDLNEPPVPPNFEDDYVVATEPAGLSSPVQPSSQQETTAIPMRRQSTRNHNPTMRALEARASGHLYVNRRRRGRSNNSTVERASRRPRPAAAVAGPNESEVPNESTSGAS